MGALLPAGAGGGSSISAPCAPRLSATPRSGTPWCTGSQEGPDVLRVELLKPRLCHHHGFAECVTLSPTSHTYLEGPRGPCSSSPLPSQLWQEAWAKKKAATKGVQADPSPSKWAQGLGTTGVCSSGATPHIPAWGGGRQAAALMLWSRNPSSPPLQLGLG